MCMQCVTTGAVVAGAAATGLRAWLVQRRPGWATPRRLKLATACLLFCGVLAASLQP